MEEVVFDLDGGQLIKKHLLGVGNDFKSFFLHPG